MIAKLLQNRGHTVAVGESLTGGLLSNHFARMEDASRWFRGGIVAYCRPVKEELLHIGSAPTVSEEAACAMAVHAARQLGATVALGATGVGGPADEDGIPAGTVWLAVHTPAGTTAELRHFAGDPDDVCRQTCETAVELLLDAISDDQHRP